ncbi:MAG: diacylglycerol kinase [Pirellulales bacterium]|nr:diacylglycerol kinase [Pirellulales bacterium]
MDHSVSPAPNSQPPFPRHWRRKFRDAFRGIKEGIRGQSSFLVHFCAAVLVVVAGAVLDVNLVEWCILALCIAGVLTVEMFNSALESMAKAITGQSDPHLGDSLDIGSAAVLIASLGASIVGSIIFINRLGVMLQWWW